MTSAGPVDLARLEALAEQAAQERERGNAEFIAALRNAAPSLLAAARAVERVEAECARAEADPDESEWVLIRDVRAALNSRLPSEIGGDECGDLLPGDEGLPFAAGQGHSPGCDGKPCPNMHCTCWCHQNPGGPNYDRGQ